MIKLYKDTLVKFNEGTHRYTVSEDQGKTWDYKPGVTSILGVLSKPALMLWPMDEALKYLFGQQFQETVDDDGEVAVKPLYYGPAAVIQPNIPYDAVKLQNALEQARAAHTARRDKGADIGHIVHKAIEDYLTGGVATTFLTNKEAQKAFDAFVRWYNDQDITFLGTEQVVYSKIFDFCGTFDALFEIDGKKVLVDFKTSNYSRTAPKGIYAENFFQLGGYALAYEEEHGEGTIDDLLIVNASKQGKVNTQYASDLGYTPLGAMNQFTNALNLYKAKTELERKLRNA